MAPMFLRVILLGVLAAAADDDVPITWFPGQRASLPCAVPLAERLHLRGPAPPLMDGERPVDRTYTWRRDGNDVSANQVSQSGILKVSSPGTYQCMVRHQGGRVLGYPIHLKFASIGEHISLTPEYATVRKGQPFALTCSISSEPPASVSWLKDELPLRADERYHLLQNQLLITDVEASDSGTYRCVATNTYLYKNLTSNTGTIQVGTSSSGLDAALLPIAFDGQIFAPRGSKIKLPCPVIGWPRPRLIWTLTAPGDRTAELETEDEVLVINNLQGDQEGVYKCSVEETDFVKTYTITLTEPATITIPPASNEVHRAGTIRFNCTAVGRPAPRITWYKDGQPIAGPGRINLRNSTDGERIQLVISGVTSEDAGVYQCFASNRASVASAWAVLSVTGKEAAAPTNVRCWPIGDKQVKVTWDKPDNVTTVYTVHRAPVDIPAGKAQSGNPLQSTEDIVTVAPLIPYRFQVRAFSNLPPTNKTVPSDFSSPAVCQSQGVPIKLVRLNDSAVLVSWETFAEDNAGVAQWILQFRVDNRSREQNVTFDGSVYNYTLSASSSSPLEVRVLGSRGKWLQQDLSLVPWSSTVEAHDIDAGDVIPQPTHVEGRAACGGGGGGGGGGGRGGCEVAVRWRCDGAGGRVIYTVCLGNGFQRTCKESKRTLVTFEDLQPGTKYEVVVQAHIPPGNGTYSTPHYVTTPYETPQRFKQLSARFVNSSTLRVSWNGPPGKYRVFYSEELNLYVEQWKYVDTNNTNYVLIPDIDPTQSTYLMVTGYNPQENSKIETIPPLFKEMDIQNPQYEYTSAGVRVFWLGAGPKVVLYSQNLTTPLDQWVKIPATEPSVEISNLDSTRPLYVIVTFNKKQRSQVLTINPRPPEGSSLYLGIGIAVGVILLTLLALAAICLWRRRKRATSPRRARRQNQGSYEENVEEESEMKMSAANGSARPLLNGHVHITENPSSKTPNGKLKKGRRYEPPFDVSRYEDPETTLETVLDADTSASTTLQLLDTSRGPEYDLSRSSRELSTNNSFAKLPDDNMNSEVTRSTFQLDNSKIQPTLQPNG